MQSTPVLQTALTNTWVQATWEDFLTFADDPTLVSGWFYYDQGWMRIEMSPLGSAHGHRQLDYLNNYCLEALKRFQAEDDRAVSRWLLATFSQVEPCQ